MEIMPILDSRSHKSRVLALALEITRQLCLHLLHRHLLSDNHKNLHRMASVVSVLRTQELRRLVVGLALGRSRMNSHLLDLQMSHSGPRSGPLLLPSEDLTPPVRLLPLAHPPITLHPHYLASLLVAGRLRSAMLPLVGQLHQLPSVNLSEKAAPEAVPLVARLCFPKRRWPRHPRSHFPYPLQRPPTPLVRLKRTGLSHLAPAPRSHSNSVRVL